LNKKLVNRVNWLHQWRIRYRLEELSVFGTPRHMLASETAHHLAQVLRHGYIVRLGIEPREKTVSWF
jgi:hypothetical protein